MTWFNERCGEHGWSVDGFATPIGCLLSAVAGPLARQALSREEAGRAADTSRKRGWFRR